MIYSTVDDVIKYSGALPDALGFDDQGELEDYVHTLLAQVSAFIESDRNNQFNEHSKYRPIADNIAMRMAGNLIRMAERQRNRSVVTIQGDGGNALQIDDAQMMTAAIEADLKRIPVKPRWRMALSIGRETEED